MRLIALLGLGLRGVSAVPLLNECSTCVSVPAADQLAAMRQVLAATTEEPGTPPDPIYGIWYLNWRLYQGSELPAGSVGEGLMAILRPEDWDESTRTYSLGMCDFTAWTAVSAHARIRPAAVSGFQRSTARARNADSLGLTLSQNHNPAGTFNLLTYKSGFIQSRDIAFGDENQITAITDQGVWLLPFLPRTFVNHWKASGCACAQAPALSHVKTAQN